ncbi:MAG: CotH kinase family protein, partial [Bacteroidota bacterium]|nr:CotH kinase family protein [Bacteroidota bacterium]
MKINTSVPFNVTLFVFFLSSLMPVKASLTDGLVLHYDFETISGTSVYDASHHNMNGTLYGNPLTVTGYSGSGVTFPTVTDYLQLPQGTVNSLTSFSITAWVKLTSLNVWSRIFDFGSGTDYNMFLTPSCGNNVRFAIKNGGTEQQINTANTLTTNEWVHVAVTFDWNAQAATGTGKLYINGMLAGTNDAISINPSMLPLTTQNYIAKSQYNDPALNGTMDDFRIYSRALTDSEILELNGFPADLMEAYNSINIAGDLTKVTNNLTLQTVTGTGEYPITWTSSSPAVVSITGTVTRPKYYDQTVILTATITVIRDGKSVKLTKEFNVTVLSTENIHWESLILENDTWKYLAPTNEPSADWYKPAFNDASWKTGPGGIGFGDSDDNTVISTCTALYLRKLLEVADVSKIDNLVLDIDYDDAFILYINGVECARSSNVSSTFPAYNATLTTGHEATMYSGGSPERYLLKPSMLVNGTNTFAIHILNQNASSSDLSSRIFIHARIQGDGIQYHEVPSWFTEPVSFETSNLPFIMVNTNGQTIIQNTKIMADMKVLNSSSGINNINDTTFEYNGKIGIEIRGFSSTGFPKKSYTVETRTDATTNLNVRLLGLPKENDWVFNGPYPDKSLMRNVLAYHLGNLTGKWSPRTKYFELYLNGTYQGLYILVEKIKVDKNRLNLASLKAADTTGDDVTGGYILKIDRPESTDIENVDYWISPYRAWTSLQQKVYFLFQNPNGEELNAPQHAYIRKCFTDFENAVYSDDYQDKVKGFYPLVDLNSFLDYYIISELSRNLDGYRISTFMHKDKDSKGGKITMGPYWDYDICFGNADFFSAGQTEG